MPVIAASSAEAGRCQQRFLAVLLRRVVGIRCQFSPKFGPVQPLFFFFTLLYFRLSFLPCLFFIANLPIREIDDYPTGRSRGLPRVGPVQVSLPFDRLTRHTHTHPFNGPVSGTTQVSRHQKVKTNLDFTEAKDSEWQWHQLGHMQVCTLLQTDNHISTPPLCFYRPECPSCRPTNSVKTLKAISTEGNAHKTLRR